MRRLLAALALAIVVAALLPTLVLPRALADSGYTKQFYAVFEESKIIAVNSSVAKLYALGKLLGSAVIEWKGVGHGYAYLDVDGRTVKVIDLSTNGTDTLTLNGNAVIRLDANAIWRGYIIITVRDVYRITVHLSTNRLTLRPGQSATVTMTIRRISGFDRWLTLQYHVSSPDISVRVDPPPPWRVGTATVRLTITASPRAYGDYRIDLWLAAHREPAFRVHRPPQVPAIQVPTPRPQLPHTWVLCGELTMIGSASIGSLAAAAVERGLGINATMVAAIIIVALLIAVLAIALRKR